MKHFTTEDWIDFVNEAVSTSKQGEMRKHLEGGCKRCAKTVALWERVRQSGAAEKEYQPAADAVHMAKTAFVGSALAGGAKKRGTLAEVLFDSFLQPVLEGARSGATGTRQMLYRADPYQIDLHIERKPEGGHLIITGQMLDMRHPEKVGRDVKVTLSNHSGHLISTVTNEFGEFRGEIENNGDLELSFAGPGEQPIVIALRNALGQAS
jgi:hypothetical protein